MQPIRFLAGAVPAEKAPAHLAAKGRRFWSEVTQGFELRVDERRLLEDACREIDLIERLEDELRTGELLVEGSMGQSVASPLIQELRAHRAVLARLLGALKLPEEPNSAGERSASARQAAMSRWSRGA